MAQHGAHMPSREQLFSLDAIDPLVAAPPVTEIDLARAIGAQLGIYIDKLAYDYLRNEMAGAAPATVHLHAEPQTADELNAQRRAAFAAVQTPTGSPLAPRENPIFKGGPGRWNI